MYTYIIKYHINRFDFRLHKVPTAQYESAHLRIFDEGRTETIRSCSNESVAFCKAMVDDKVHVDQKVKLMRVAITEHQKYARNALQGIGVDRHMLGLKLMALENNLPVPAFFSSPGFVKSQHFRVSTSQVASSFEAFMGYGPGVDDGYAACYNPRDRDIIVSCAAWNFNPETNANKFALAVQDAFIAMKKVLEQEEASKCKL